jgi:hypothetical protein
MYVSKSGSAQLRSEMQGGCREVVERWVNLCKSKKHVGVKICPSQNSHAYHITVHLVNTTTSSPRKPLPVQQRPARPMRKRRLPLSLKLELRSMQQLITKHAAARNEANTETDGAKDENNATEDDDAAEPKAKPKSERSGVHRCQGPTNKAPASQRTATRATNTDQHPKEQYKAPRKKATHQRRRPRARLRRTAGKSKRDTAGRRPWRKQRDVSGPDQPGPDATKALKREERMAITNKDVDVVPETSTSEGEDRPKKKARGSLSCT